MLLYIACVHVCEPIFSENNIENIWKCQMWFNCSPPSFWSDISRAFQRQLSFTQRWTDWHMNDDIKISAVFYADIFVCCIFCRWLQTQSLLLNECFETFDWLSVMFTLEDKVVGFSGFLLLFNQSCEKIKTSNVRQSTTIPVMRL